VVGDILGQFFDASGRVVPLPIHDRRSGTWRTGSCGSSCGPLGCAVRRHVW
jgi:Putative sugar-binding domain